MSKKTKDAAISFEDALKRLEEIVAEMEGGDLGLDRMMADFEEGNGLVRFCTAKLNEVERKIEKLVQKGDESATEPFDDAGAAPEDGAPGDAAAGGRANERRL
jgi:exodeoxyribonuclease VII small subunit